MSDKNIENEILSPEEKQDIKALLEDFSSQIKSKEETSWIDTNLDEKLANISAKVDKLETKSEAEQLLDGLKKELSVLNEHNELKDLLRRFELKLEEEKQKYLRSYKDEFSSLKNQVIKNKLPSTPEEIKQVANEGRKNALAQIEKWIVAKLAQRDDWIGKLARKALG
jgi:thermostable 8-oxoguanine DNA glycosylase